MKVVLKKSLLMVISSLLWIEPALAADGFKVERIRYIGLKRISASTLANYLEVKKGQVLTQAKSTETIKSLYKTGFFQAVELERQGQVLVVRVVERGTIGSISFKGNSSISSDQLKAVLKQLGLTKGNVFQRAALERFQQQLKVEFNMRGKYNARIDTQIMPLTQNRVGIVIDISEGRVARIKAIKFIDNHAFSNDELKDLMSLSEQGVLTYFTKKDQYSQTALDESLQAIRNYYMDHGYLKFRIDSSQVMLDTDYKSVYINIKVTEGPQYHFSGFDISGKTILAKEKITSLINIEKGAVFSRKQVTDAIKSIGEALGDIGYGFPAINAEPKIDEAKRTIFITFMIQPGRHVYVRRINFIGNTKTADYVLRQAIKQDEGGILSLTNIKESERQLKILGYLKNVNVKTIPVANANNQVDLEFNVEEAPSAEASISIGYGTNGPEFNASFNQHNFMGTGRTFGFNFNTSYWGKNYGINYYDPFYGINGLGRGFDVYIQTVDPKRLDISAYTSDKYGFNVNYNLLIGDTASLQFGYGLERLKITSTGNNPATQLQNFVNTYGSRFDQLRLSAGWNNNSYDQQPFPQRGTNQQVSVMMALPVSKGSLKYYKTSYQIHSYAPIFNSGFVFTSLANIAYGNMFNNQGLPFYENYFAGGIAQPGQVRGYDSYSLGPLDSRGNSLGGNFLVSGSLGLILPYPLSKESVRSSVFFDYGNVYAKHILASLKGTGSGKVRYSAGVAVDWRSPFGPLSFSLAKPLNRRPRDKVDNFQFTVTSGF